MVVQVQVSNLELNPGEIASDAATLEKRDTEAFGVIPVKFQVEGTFSQVQEFFTIIEQQSPFTTIATIRLNTQSETQEEAQNSDSLMSAELLTNTFYYTQTVQAAIEAPLPVVSGQQREVLEQLARFTAINIPIQGEVTGGGSEDPFKTE